MPTTNHGRPRHGNSLYVVRTQLNWSGDMWSNLCTNVCDNLLDGFQENALRTDNDGGAKTDVPVTTIAFLTQSSRDNIGVMCIIANYREIRMNVLGLW